MLTPEQVRQQLGEQTQPEWLQRHATTLKRKAFPGAHAWLQSTLGDQPRNTEAGRALVEEARAFRVSTYSHAQRLELFQTLYPKLADHLEATWHAIATQPYRLSRWSLSGFRAPAHPLLVDRARDAWVTGVIAELRGFDPDPVWLATWGAHLGYFGVSDSCSVLATVIDRGDALADEVFEILRQSASNQHEIGVMGQHVIRTLLQCARPEAWEFVAKMLLAAQREEGLRQRVLDGASAAHPGAFRRLLQLILDEDVVRFASTVRAIDVWFGFMWESMATKHARSIVERAAKFLDDADARGKATAGKDAETAYLALWCEAHHNPLRATEIASKLLSDSSPERRWLGVHVLDLAGLPESIEPLSEALGDHDIRVQARAMDAIAGRYRWNWSDAGLCQDSDPSAAPAAVLLRIFEHLEASFRSFSRKEVKFEPLVFPWGRSVMTAKEVGNLLVTFCPPGQGERLVELIHRLSTDARAKVAWLVAGFEGRDGGYGLESPKVKSLTPLARATLVELLGDASPYVRSEASTILGQVNVTPEEVAQHEALCARVASDIRTRAISRLALQRDGDALASAERLLDGKGPRALAGAGLLRHLAEAGRSREAIAALVAKRLAAMKPKDKGLAAALKELASTRTDAPLTCEDAFGLAQPFVKRALPTVRKIEHAKTTAAAMECIWSLNDFVEANKTFELKIDGNPHRFVSSSDEPDLLGSIRGAWRWTPDDVGSVAEAKAKCPVTGLIEAWEAARSAKTRDADGLELVRAWVALRTINTLDYTTKRAAWAAEVESKSCRKAAGPPPLHEGITVLVAWLLRLKGPDASEFFLDQIEGAIERGDLVREDARVYVDKRSNPRFVGTLSAEMWLEHYRECPAVWTSRHALNNLRRLEGLCRAGVDAFERSLSAKAATLQSDAASGESMLDEGFLEVELDEFLALWEAGDVSDDELMVRIVRTGQMSGHQYYGKVCDLAELIERRKPQVASKPAWRERQALTPRLDALLERIRKRVLQIELARGDAETPATPHAFSMDPSGGIDAAIPALAGLGKLKLVRGYIYNDTGKAASFSRLIQKSRPGEADWPAAFAAAAKAAGLTDTQLVALALYAPRWAAHVEHATGWAGLEAGVLWLRSHTKDRDSAYRIEEEKEPWEARVAELTPISPDSLGDGAVDRAWFERCYKQLGAKRWEVLYDAAKYASIGGGHIRARLFADAMLGHISEKEMVTRITTKRHQDVARALGLLKVKPGEAGHKQVLARYKVLQEMRRTSRKHGGSILQASEKRAVEIGMENLAWTAGFPDPLRLQWAMEVKEFGDLAKGPVTVKVGETVVTLAVDEEGTPSLSAVKGGKPLKIVPPAIKKDKSVAVLATRMTELRRQASRIRHSLEHSMCRGDTFEGAELVTLFGHPLLRHSITRLVMVGTTKSGGTLMGYPDKGGKALRGVDGQLEPTKGSDTLRIAHPLDLLGTKAWHEWQAECFRAERVQPFKQIFREVSVPLATETAKAADQGGNRCTRYTGQQVQPKKAMALFGARGWVARPEEGVQRTFHHERVTVRVEFEEGFCSPAEIDGLTLAGVRFAAAGTETAIAVRDVPPRVFSEIMRDLDLVVSVAHRGQVDPEASQSTVGMREALLRETCALLSLRNVSFEKSRAIIKGELGEYALHLGSGVIHKLPGGAMWILPVHSQHRGRVYLPFADDDPKTAEIISKALLLARDRMIKDPGILAQIRAG